MGLRTAIRPQRASTRGPIPEQAGCWLILLGVYVLVGVLFFYSGKGKLFDDNGDAPPALKKQFQGTFIDKVPGVNAAWVIIGVLELAIVTLIIISLLQREFLPSRTKFRAHRRARARHLRLPVIRPDLDRQQSGHRIAVPVLRLHRDHPHAHLPTAPNGTLGAPPPQPPTAHTSSG